MRLVNNAAGIRRAVGATLPALLLVLVAFGGCSSSDDPTPTGTGTPVAPTASFTATPNAANPLMVVFTDTSDKGSADITAWAWAFGDGNTSDEQNPTHTYAAEGTYNVTLTVTSSVGSNARTSPSVINIEDVAPTADFSTLTRQGVTPLTVVFQDLSSPGSAPITTWAWDFGDGTTSPEQNPTHVYGEDGLYDVSLRVTTADGTNEKTTADYVESYSLRVVDGQIDARPGQSPAIPLPTSYNQILPSTSSEMYIGQAVVQDFKPMVSLANLTSWTADSETYIDCPNAFVIPEPASPTVAWRPAIPRRSTTDKYYYLLYTPNEEWPGTFPARFTVYSTTYGMAGGFARWSSCEERGSFIDEWTSHVVSYNQPAQQVPYIRHYTKWVKAYDVPLGETGSTTNSYSVAYGVTSTTAYEFTSSITASVGVEVDGFSANLSTTLSQTFSESLSVETRTEQSRSYTSGSLREGYEQRFYLWQLVDVFQVEGNVPGQLWSDPNLQLNNPSTELRIEAPQNTYAVVSVWFRK
jgi:PKD repeat protein